MAANNIPPEPIPISQSPVPLSQIDRAPAPVPTDTTAPPTIPLAWILQAPQPVTDIANIAEPAIPGPFAGYSIAVYANGVLLTSQAQSIDFVGNAVVATVDRNNVTVTINSTGSGGNTDWANIGNINNANGPSEIAIGTWAGNAQGASAVAIGPSAGNSTQGTLAIAIGSGAGQTSQGNSSVAIGEIAGQTAQGIGAVAIGAYAGANNQANNTIILNATRQEVNGVSAQGNSFYVAPVRNDTGNTTNALYYNTSTFEISYGPAGAGGNYGNANVATFLGAFGSNTINTTGTITGGNFTQSGVGNVNGYNAYFSNNITAQGTVQATGLIIPAGSGTFYGNTTTGVNALFAGVPGYTELGTNVVAQFAANVNSYAQLNFQNLNAGELASADYILTADNGNNSAYYLDLGLASSTHVDPYFFGDVGFANDGYLTVVGPTYDGPSTSSGPGNLVLGSSNGLIKMFVGNASQANVIATVSSTGLDVVGNITTGGVSGNITGANVISANTFAIVGNTVLGQIEGANTVGFYNANANTQFLIELGGSNAWSFNGNTGGTGFPILSVQRGDNPSGTISGQTLLFDNAGQEAIVSTPNGNPTDGINSQRLVINPGEGYDSGEGGDIYLWAGRGGNASGSGGDIKIRGGQGGANTAGGVGGDGGYIRIEAGDTAATGGYPGYVEITGGINSTGQGGYVRITGGSGPTGGDVEIFGGYGDTIGGNINIIGGYGPDLPADSGNVNINAGTSSWQFTNTGNLNLPQGGIVYETLIPGGILTGNTIALKPQGGTDSDQQLLIYPTAIPGADVNHLHLTSGNLYNTELFLGDDFLYVKLANTGNIVINSDNNVGNSGQWNFDYNGVLTLPNADASGFGNIYFEQNSSTITFGLDDNTIPYLYSFATSGITLPTGGATIRDTAGNAVAFGRDAAATGPQGNAAVAIGQQAGETSQGASSVAIGYQAGFNTQNANAVAIGREAGQTTQQAGAVAVGLNAGTYIQGQNAVASGSKAGQSSQGIEAVAVGLSAGNVSQGQWAVAVGSFAGNNAQGEGSVAVGKVAGWETQGNSAVAVGDSAGNDTQGIGAVAVGTGAGEITQGEYAIAVGYLAGSTSQGNNSIILNATGNILNQTTANTFTVAPVRNDVANTAEVMFYNTTSKEITYGNTISVSGNITGANIITAGAGGDIALTGGNVTGANVVSANTVSATGNITGAYFIGNGSQLTGVTASIPSQTILPTIQTITISATSSGGGGGQGSATVTVANTIPVTEYGVIITDGTISQTYATGALGSIPGTVLLPFTTGLNVTPFTVYAYVTSNAGTYYSNAATGTSGICLLAGTQIALSDGTRKAIEHITYTDKMLSWDFDLGCYAETTALWIKRSETGSQYNLLTFSDGTTLRTFDQHRIFNKQAGAFTYPMTAATPIGTVTVNEHGQEITLVNKQIIVDTIEYYNVITDRHMNLFSDSILTSCRFNNIYPIADMKFVKDDRTLRTRAEFENIPDRFFYGLRLAEQTTDVETVEWYVNRLLATEVYTEAELAV